MFWTNFQFWKSFQSERNQSDLIKSTQTNQIESKIGVYPVFYTEDLFYNFAEPYLPIYLGFIGEDIQFYHIPVRNRHLTRCSFGSDQEFQSLVRLSYQWFNSTLARECSRYYLLVVRFFTCVFYGHSIHLHSSETWPCIGFGYIIQPIGYRLKKLHLFVEHCFVYNAWFVPRFD